MSIEKPNPHTHLEHRFGYTPRTKLQNACLTSTFNCLKASITARHGGPALSCQSERSPLLDLHGHSNTWSIVYCLEYLCCNDQHVIAQGGVEEQSTQSFSLVALCLKSGDFGFLYRHHNLRSELENLTAINLHPTIKELYIYHYDDLFIFTPPQKIQKTDWILDVSLHAYNLLQARHYVFTCCPNPYIDNMVAGGDTLSTLLSHHQEGSAKYSFQSCSLVPASPTHRTRFIKFSLWEKKIATTHFNNILWASEIHLKHWHSTVVISSNLMMMNTWSSYCYFLHERIRARIKKG